MRSNPIKNEMYFKQGSRNEAVSILLEVSKSPFVNNKKKNHMQYLITSSSHLIGAERLQAASVSLHV